MNSEDAAEGIRSFAERHEAKIQGLWRLSRFDRARGAVILARVFWQTLIPLSCGKSSTSRSVRESRTYTFAASRIVFGYDLK